MNFNKNIAIIDYFIKFLTKFATDSVSEEAEAASPDSTFVDGGLLSTEKVLLKFYLQFSNLAV